MFNLYSRSQLFLSLSRSKGTLCWFGLSFCWEGGREKKHVAEHAAAANNFGKRKGHLLSLSLHLYSPINEVGCLRLV
jgi:hypothetical protein